MNQTAHQTNHRPARRTILQAGLLVGMSGCSNSSVLFDQVVGRALRLATPWPAQLREQLATDFDKWITENSLTPIRIEWFACSDNDVAAFSSGASARLVDALVGGHVRSHQALRDESRMTFHLAAVRTPVVVADKFTQVIGWQSVSEPNLWPSAGPPLAFPSPLLDELSRVYSMAVWNSNPDQAIGYARWIKLARGFAVTAKSHAAARLALVPSNSSPNAWKGGAGLNEALGLQPAEPVHWPEALTFFDSDAGGMPLRDLFQRFCHDTNRLKTVISADKTASAEVMLDLAAILLDRCHADLQAAWQVIDQSTGEERARTERYLTERPPWPPASVQDLAKRRGFEYVVALVEQMAVDGDERDWLIHEFQQPAGLVDLKRLENAVDGRLKNSIRFRAWLRAEWSAWVRQRCRRVQRFLTEL